MRSRTYQIDVAHPRAGAIEDVARVLLSGGVALIPTDTTYSLVSVVRSGNGPSGGIGRLFDIKRRNPRFTFPWLVSSPAALEVYGTDVSEEARLLANGLWPSGLAIIVHASAAVPRRLARYDGTIALRMSASPVVSGVIHACGRPLVATGANLHEGPDALSLDDIAPEVLDFADIVLDGGVTGAGQSTIVDCTEGELAILREGAVPVTDLMNVVQL